MLIYWIVSSYFDSFVKIHSVGYQATASLHSGHCQSQAATTLQHNCTAQTQTETNRKHNCSRKEYIYSKYHECGNSNAHDSKSNYNEHQHHQHHQLLTVGEGKQDKGNWQMVYSQLHRGKGETKLNDATAICFIIMLPAVYISYCSSI